MTETSTPGALIPEDFVATRQLYDEAMAENVTIHDLVYPAVFGEGQYVGQFSDNSAKELEAMGAALELGAASRVLDIGCGRGAVATFLAERFDWEVVGIDLAEVPLLDAERRRAKLPGSLASRLSFLTGNVYEQPFEHPFDGIYGTGAFCHFDAARLFAHAYSLLRPGGRIGFMERVRLDAITPDDWRCLTEEWHCPFVYTTEEYRTALTQCGFESISVIDLTPTFRFWQERSVSVREQMASDIIARTSASYHERALAHARYEADVTRKGALGYALIVATRSLGVEQAEDF